MRRRSFLASLAAFFGFGVAAETESRANAYSDAETRRMAAAAADGFDMPLITPVGHVFRCENGHPVCEAIKPLVYGRTQNWHEHIGNWRQREPEAGKPIPWCAQCGARVVFWRNNRGINAP